MDGQPLRGDTHLTKTLRNLASGFEAQIANHVAARVPSPPRASISMQQTGDTMTDRDLLRHYADTGSQEAFAELVRRHIDWVYAVCRRRVGDTALAEDVTQAVFIVLSRKASQLSKDTVMTGWLMTTAKYASADALKSKRRREHYEAAASRERLETISSSATMASDAVLSDLDEAMLRLSDVDRSAIVLRYYKNCTVLEVAEALNISEEAAKKRLSRGLDRLRKLMSSSRSRTAFAVGATLPVLLASTSSQAAPAGLTQTTVAAAITGKACAALAIAKGTASMMAWSKAKASALIALVIALLGTATTIAVVSSLPVRSAPSTTVAPVTKAANPLDTVTIDADPNFHRVIPKHRLRFSDTNGTYDRYYFVMQVWGTPDNSVTAMNVVVERDREAVAMLVQTMDGRPYLFATGGWAVRVDNDIADTSANSNSTPATSGLVIAEGLWPAVNLKAQDGGPRDAAMIDWSVSLDRSRPRINVDLASIIEGMQVGPISRTYTAASGIVRLQSQVGGGAVTVPSLSAANTDMPPVTQFNFSEKRRLGIGIDGLRIGSAASNSMTRVSRESLDALGIQIRKVKPEEFGAGVFPPNNFWHVPGHRTVAAKLRAGIPHSTPSVPTTQRSAPPTTQPSVR